MPSNVGMKPGTELAGKVALVTGAGAQYRSRDRALAGGGRRSVMVNARTSRAEGERTVEMIGSERSAAHRRRYQAGGGQQVRRSPRCSAGRLGFLVNNAAVRYETPFDRDRTVAQVLAIVLDGAFLTAQAAGCLCQAEAAERS